MCHTSKKQIERNLKELAPEGSTHQIIDRETGEVTGLFTIVHCSREEISGLAQGRPFGHDGREIRFRIPALTQRGGNHRLELSA
jgi:hypothetical protein